MHKLKYFIIGFKDWLYKYNKLTVKEKAFINMKAFESCSILYP